MPNLIEAFLRSKFPWFFSTVKFIVKWRLITIIPIIILSIKVYRLDKVIYIQSLTIDEQNKRIALVELENLQLKKINTELVSNAISGNRALDKIKQPIWSKLKRGNRFIAQVANNAFEQKFLRPERLDRYEYLGNTDYDVFPYESAKMFNDGDSLVAITGEDLLRIEKFKDVSGAIVEEEVVKWRDIIGKDTLVWGMIQRKN